MTSLTDRIDSQPKLNQFALTAGTYVALLLGAVSTVAVGHLLPPLAIVVLAVVSGLVVTAVLATRPGLPSRFARTRLRYLVWLPLLLLTPWLVGAVTVDDLAFSPWVVVAFAALLAGLLSNTLAKRALVRTVRDGGTAAVEWVAAAPRRTRRVYAALALGASVLVLVVGLAIAAHFALPSSVFSGVVGGLGGGLATQALVVGTRHRYLVTDDWLLVSDENDRSYNVRLVPWSWIRGYELTEDQLVVRRWVPPLAFHCDRADIEDIDAVTDALDRALDDTVTDYRN